jgi:hypothetical protein
MIFMQCLRGSPDKAASDSKSLAFGRIVGGHIGEFPNKLVVTDRPKCDE